MSGRVYYQQGSDDLSFVHAQTNFPTFQLFRVMKRASWASYSTTIQYELRTQYSNIKKIGSQLSKTNKQPRIHTLTLHLLVICFINSLATMVFIVFIGIGIGIIITITILFYSSACNRLI